MIGTHERQRERLQCIRDTSQALMRAVDFEGLFAILHLEVTSAVPADTFFLGLFDEASQTINVVRQAEFGVELPGGTFPLGHGPTSEVIRSHRSRLIRHWSVEAPRVQVQYLSGTPGLPESGIIVPMLAGEHVLGVIAVHKYAPAAFDQDDLLVLEALAAQAALTLVGLGRSEQLTTQLLHRVSELQAILSTMADALVILDADGRVVALNRSARELLCVDEAGVVLGQPLEHQTWGQWALGRREITETLTPMLTALQRGESAAEAEVRLEHNGRRTLSFSGTPLRDADGHVTGAVLVARDVTGAREVEELKSEMLSVASHDLKTPVTVIRAQAQLLRRAIERQAITLDDVNTGLGEIVGETQRLAKLLAAVLDFSTIEAGRLTLRPRRLDMVALVSAAIAEVQTTTDKHRLELHVSGAGEPVGYWDDRRLQQVLDNLLTNAVKYSPDGGIVDVDIESYDHTVSVRISDQGIGLRAEEAEHVFERFYRGDTMRRLEGSGLGLHICHSIVAAHGGRIWVESPGPGCGSSFSFILPTGGPSVDFVD
jgi:PAS domain S-box-containing protein